MRRLHLLEIHEQPWCPAAVRAGATDCLTLIENVGGQYRYVLPLIAQALAAGDRERIVDLCSGSGGPWFRLARDLESLTATPREIVLTDLYPSATAIQRADAYSRAAGTTHTRIQYLARAVDVTEVPNELTGFRTLFTAFHHFPPAIARTILQDAVDSGQGIGIFEQTRRSPLAFFLMFTLPVVVWLITPFIRPFRWSRLFWTYLVPAIPCVLWLDGLVSCLRTYSPAELDALIAGLNAPGYHWQTGRVRSPFSPLGVTYAVGYRPNEERPAVNDGATERRPVNQAGVETPG